MRDVQERRWTLDAARQMLGEVRGHTARAVPEVEALLAMVGVIVVRRTPLT